ncbi:amino acid ABC transporter permease [Ornithinimicrobium cavernae]|uniref:amino acid ABC transporter permease n=1 Tax=Ornithinimicrobium cavernae TaxID=2666047 RepID=UPI000D687386|nr:amino acid ABC transporter permease [Ornithinimicrobium cavernae]
MTPEVLLSILQGLPTTLVLTAGALALGALGGIPLVLLRRSPVALIRLPVRLLIEVLRGIPPIVWLFLIFFGLPSLGVRLGPLTAGILGMGAISAAYLAEIYRGGLAAVNQGQYEASMALGMSTPDMMSRIVGPQVVRVSVPAVATYGIGLLKDSSIAFTIGVNEMLYFASSESRATTDAIGPFLTVAAVYILLSVLSAWGARTLNARLRRRVAR